MTVQDNPTTTVGRIRAVFEAHPGEVLDLDQVAAESGVDRDRISIALASDVKRRKLEKVDVGRYRLPHGTAADAVRGFLSEHKGEIITIPMVVAETGIPRPRVTHLLLDEEKQGTLAKVKRGQYRVRKTSVNGTRSATRTRSRRPGGGSGGGSVTADEHVPDTQLGTPPASLFEPVGTVGNELLLKDKDDHLWLAAPVQLTRSSAPTAGATR